jgi:hypothetical protein
LPPVQQGREFDSLNTAGDSKTQEQAVEMCFDGSSRHLQLAGDFGIITALQKQFDDLLFTRTEPNGLLLHSYLPLWISFALAR